MKSCLLCLAALFAALFAAITCLAGNERPHPHRKIVIQLQHVIGNEQLVLGNSFVNALGDTISVLRFKYYVSHFSITDDTGRNHSLPDTYFLVDEADSSSKTITLTIPDVPIAGIRFLIGVDSIKNVSGIQTGALDPLKGMFWTWNSGYVMAKLEGHSSSSTIVGQSFTYHIGGFRVPMNVIRPVAFYFSEKKPVHSIILTADINHWFKSKSELNIAETPVCHSPGPLAVRIADNYSTMFSISAIR